MSYVLRNNQTGKYVAPPGSMRSYTPRLESARKFQTREQAQADACGNETVLSLEEAASQ